MEKNIVTARRVVATSGSDSMKRFSVWATEISYYLTKTIDAKDEEEAKDKYRELMEEGMIDVNDSEINEVQAEEIKVDKDGSVV